MWAIVKDSKLVKLTQGNESITEGEIVHPKSIFRHWTQSQLKAVGVYEFISANAPDGGDTIFAPCTSSEVKSNGGGGGGGYNTSGADGGSGGGNGGLNSSTALGDATANTGSGGGGGPHTATGGDGGSGIVVLRMLDADYSGTTSGSPTVSTNVGGSGETVIIFNASGSYTA